MSLLPWRKPTPAPQTQTPAQSLASFQQEMNHLFESFFGQSPLFRSPAFEGMQALAFPAVSVADNDTTVTVTAEMPGVAADDIHIHVDGDLLTLSGEKKEEKKEDKDNFHRVERSYGAFTRRIQLPANVDSAHAEATLEAGVLTLKLPKIPADKAKRIKVQTK